MEMEDKSIKSTALDKVQITNEEFRGNNILPKWISYSTVSKVKSIRRAIRRGHVNLMFGTIYPKRPFNNRKDTSGRYYNQSKKKIYEQLKRL